MDASWRSSCCGSCASSCCIDASIWASGGPAAAAAGGTAAAAPDVCMLVPAPAGRAAEGPGGPAPPAAAAAGVASAALVTPAVEQRCMVTTSSTRRAPSALLTAVAALGCRPNRSGVSGRSSACRAASVAGPSSPQLGAGSVTWEPGGTAGWLWQQGGGRAGHGVSCVREARCKLWQVVSSLVHTKEASYWRC
jgi:hypothetical protein